MILLFHIDILFSLASSIYLASSENPVWPESTLTPSVISFYELYIDDTYDGGLLTFFSVSIGNTFFFISMVVAA